MPDEEVFYMKPAKKDLITFFKTRSGRPLLVREVMRQLKLKTEDRHDLKVMLAGLVTEGHIAKSRRFPNRGESMEREDGIQSRCCDLQA